MPGVLIYLDIRMLYPELQQVYCLLPQACTMSFHRDCKDLQDLLDPGDCQEKL